MKEERTYSSGCPCNHFEYVGYSKKEPLTHQIKEISPEGLLELKVKGVKVEQVGRPVIVNGRQLDTISNHNLVLNINPYGEIPPRENGEFPDFYMSNEYALSWPHSPLVFYKIVDE